MTEVVNGRVDVERDRLVIRGSDSERLSYNTTALPLRSEWILPNGNVWEWTTVGWVKTSSGGAVRVTTGGDFTPTNFAAPLSANGSAGAVQYDTMATGSVTYKITNKDLTAGDNLLVAWGADESEAAINIAAGGEVILANSKDVFNIPQVARDGGKMAYLSESVNTIAFQGSQGV